jgi:hypothetical protein
MPAAQILEVDLSSWRTWVVPLSGILVASVLLLLGVLIGRRSRKLSSEEAVGSFLPGSVADRRRWQRRKGNRVAVLLADARSHGKSLEAWVLDRSEGGLCLLLDDPVEMGTLWKARPAGAAEAVPWLTIEARACRPTLGGCAVGFRFLQAPPLHVLLLFG